MNTLDIIDKIRETEAHIAQLNADLRPSLSEFQAAARQACPLMPAELKRLKKELGRQRFAPAAEIVQAIIGYWQNGSVLGGPNIYEAELVSYVDAVRYPKRLIALCQLQCSLEDLIGYAAESFVPNPGRLSEATRHQRGEQVAALTESRADLCARLVGAAKADAV